MNEAGDDGRPARISTAGGGPTHGPPHVLRPGIRTYKPRRTRITARSARALAEQQHLLLPASAEPLDVAREWGADMPLVVEIGFGDGSATARMAAADPHTAILAVDVHTPGVGDLLARLGEGGLTNVRVVEGDALGVLAHMVRPSSLIGIRSYFPDPWPKTRHHKRRLVQSEVIDLVHSRLMAEGSWHLATDWSEYAAWIDERLGPDPRWIGGPIARPDWRPLTRYERRALRDGRAVTDLLYRRSATG